MDARLRELVRAAQETGSGRDALAAAHALARAGAVDLAGAQLLAAARAGEDVLDVAQRLVPAGLDAFRERVLGQRFACERVNHLGWAPDASALYALVGKKTHHLVRFPVHGGASEVVCPLPHAGRGVAVDASGRTVVCTKDASDSGTQLYELDGARGELAAPFLSASDWFSTLSLYPLPDRLLLKTSKAVRAYSLGEQGPRPAWSMGGESVAYGLSGAVAYKKKAAEVRLFDLGARKPRVKVSSEVACPERFVSFSSQHPDLFAVGKGALIVYQVLRPGGPDFRWAWEAETDWWVTRLGPDGAILQRTKLPEDALQRCYPCPGGRYLLLTRRADRESKATRSTQAALHDLLTGDLREVELPALPRSVAWSPSGCAAAVGTDEGTIYLLDAGPRSGAGPPEEVGSGSPEEWVELNKGERFWRARREGAAVEVHYGIRGTQGTRRRAACADGERASKELARRVREKQRRGYA